MESYSVLILFYVYNGYCSLAFFCPNVTDESLPESVLCRCFQQSSNLGYMNVFTSVSIIPINLS